MRRILYNCIEVASGIMAVVAFITGNATTGVLWLICAHVIGSRADHMKG